MKIACARFAGNCQKGQRALLFPRLELLEIGFDILERRRERLGHISIDDLEVGIADGMATGMAEHLHFLIGQYRQPVPRRNALQTPHTRCIKFFAAHGRPLLKLAGREGFEPPERFHVRRFSRPEQSTALPSTRWMCV